MSTAAAILRQLKAKANPVNVAGMARFGMSPDKRLGLSMPDLRQIARQTGPDHRLAQQLWRTGIPEARILAGMLADPETLTEAELEAWVASLDSWDVCDQLCMNLLEKSPLARHKIAAWAAREEAFVKRAAFALVACLAWHDKQVPDQEFLGYLPIIERGAADGRNFVKKAVSWALRNVGKRSPRLNRAAIQSARRLQKSDAKAARWVAAGALRELQGEAVQQRLKR